VCPLQASAQREQNGKPPVRVLLDNKAWSQRLLDLDQGRFKAAVMFQIGHLLGNSAQCGVTGQPAKDVVFERAFHLPSNRRAQHRPDDKAQCNQQQHCHDPGMRRFSREMRTNRLNKYLQFHQHLYQKKHGEPCGQYDQYSTQKGGLEEGKDLLHALLISKFGKPHDKEIVASLVLLRTAQPRPALDQASRVTCC